MSSMSKTISREAALAAAQALNNAIKWRRDRIEWLKANPSMYDEAFMRVLQRMLDEDKAAFKEVAGYEWFD